MNAACAGITVPLWDAHVEGENEVERTQRLASGLRFCGRCEVRSACEASIDPKHDDGIKGGRVLPVISDKHRRSPYPQGFADACWTPGELAATLRRRATGTTAKQIRPPAAPSPDGHGAARS